MPPLELLQSPYRRLSQPLLDSVVGLEKQHPERIIAVVVPELHYTPPNALAFTPVVLPVMLPGRLCGSLPVTRLALSGQEEPIRMKRTSLRPLTTLALGLCVPLTVVLATGAVGAAASAPKPPVSSRRSGRA